VHHQTLIKMSEVSKDKMRSAGF